MSYLARVTLLYLLPFLCSSSPGDSCQHPEGVNGETYIEGCVKHTCKKGVWRPSIDKSTCCFNGEAFEFGSRISTVDDDCTTAYLECTNNGIETVISISPHCSPAQKIQVNEIKDLLKQHILVADDSDCSNSSSITQEEKDILLIGPGYPNNLQSEVFTLPSFTSSSCVPPIFPHDDYHGYVGTTTPDGPLLCGGTHSGRRQSACYLLDKKGVWVTVGHQMSSKRFGAASVQTERVWWVTGGHSGDYWLSSTEVWDGSSWSRGDSLPTPLHGHCMTKINRTHIFLVGGATSHSDRTAAAYIYSETTGWVQTESMRVSRYWHACGLHDDNLVFVAGGYGSNTGYTTEYFDLEDMAWYAGPSVETDTAGGEIISLEGKTYWIGQKNIWELVWKDNERNWSWEKVAEMRNGGQSSQGFLLKEKDCKYW